MRLLSIGQYDSIEDKIILLYQYNNHKDSSKFHPHSSFQGVVKKETEIGHMKSQQKHLKTKKMNHLIYMACVDEYQRITL